MHVDDDITSVSPWDYCRRRDVPVWSNELVSELAVTVHEGRMTLGHPSSADGIKCLITATANGSDGFSIRTRLSV